MNIPTAYRHRHCHRDGFTLLEIMVVVIILGVLAVT
ncbi:MAG: prepilin-type N-terminal cleavage/methylation domain-containing protein, partial [Chloroflexi bacterium]|nr:prepilin-type N-terminal cleavage/methylation domain-containing protein [Chloroflexota bacterium]